MDLPTRHRSQSYVERIPTQDRHRHTTSHPGLGDMSCAQSLIITQHRQHPWHCTTSKIHQTEYKNKLEGVRTALTAHHESSKHRPRGRTESEKMVPLRTALNELGADGSALPRWLGGLIALCIAFFRLESVKKVHAIEYEQLFLRKGKKKNVYGREPARGGLHTSPFGPQPRKMAARRGLRVLLFCALQSGRETNNVSAMNRVVIAAAQKDMFRVVLRMGSKPSLLQPTSSP